MLVLSIVLTREAAADRPRLDAAWRETTSIAPPAPHRGIGAALAVRVLGVAALAALATAVAVAVLGNGWWLVAFSVLPAVAVLVARRSHLSPRTWLAGFATAVAMLAIEALFRANVVGGLVLGTVIAPQVMAGALLLEEAWARLFLLPLLYLVFRSASGATTGRALLFALLLSLAAHGLAHAPQSIATVTNALFSALVYGLPLALLFLRRGLESAIGYEFFIDFVRFAYVIVVLHG